ncbi:MAG: NADH-quinone oxidoreductase subunit NuoK [Blastopirellula sp.]|nr:NADH-quinone oxidoreductase subunit NuoK [Blastopirellula sp.]|tara:strand:+ start:92 stop:427 length:336 start_codon:yes stop_codon:yes gene_type:complete
MNLFGPHITVQHYLIVGAVLFVTGVVCMATKRNALGVLMGIELVLNGANLNFIAFGSKFLREDTLGLDGQLIALFVIVLAAGEAAVALAIALNFYNNYTTIDVDQADELKG